MEKREGCVLIVDDDPDVLLSARLYLEQFIQHVIALSKPTDMIAVGLKNQVDVMLIDMNYRKGKNDGEEGLFWLREIQHSSLHCKVIVMTAYSDVALAVEAMKLGAIDFIQKPWENQKLLATVNNAITLNKQEKELKALKNQKELWLLDKEKPQLIGDSLAMQQIRALIAQVGPTDANILITGENGTGKEEVAKLIHEASERRNKAFVKIDLGSIPSNLFESELFGAKKGAYTDLKEDKKGRIAMADKGSLFLDEIGNLSVELQAKMLSVLQNRQVLALGTHQPIAIDVRVIAATNAHLDDMIEAKAFRQDFLYRIRTIEIAIPPLRERIEDIVPLLNYYLDKFKAKYRKPQLTISAAAYKALQEHQWPGNVRELQHSAERAVILAKGTRLEAKDFGLNAASRPQTKQSSLRLDEVERAHIQAVFEQFNGNISKAASALGITRAALYRRLEKHQL